MLRRIAQIRRTPHVRGYVVGGERVELPTSSV
jgi:hypothetical protein